METLEAIVVAWNSYSCTVAINGTRYVYRSYSIPGFKLKSTFEGIAKHSPGKAVQWIKGNAEMIDKY